jgi:hypothetical protein
LPDGDGREWNGRLVERVRRCLLNNGMAWMVAPRTTLGYAKRWPSFTSDDLPAPDLPAQWQRPLDGRRLSMEQLAQAAGKKRARRGGKQATNSQPAGGKDGRQEQSRLRPDRDGTRETATSHDNGAVAQAHSGRQRERPRYPLFQRRPPLEQTAAWDGDERHEGNGAERVPASELAPAARFAPPQMAELLPPLRPPSAPGALSLAAAAAAARKSAAAEAADDDEELDELARKLNKILAEESRRHGIDV